MSWVRGPRSVEIVVSNIELPDLDSVMRTAGRLEDHGFPIEWGVGRHGPGNNIFAYFAGPDEADRRQSRAARHGLVEIPAGRSDQWGVPRCGRRVSRASSGWSGLPRTETG